jgi:tetratricopeptide (TPR) repeat protein/predicted aspartyl protease
LLYYGRMNLRFLLPVSLVILVAAAGAQTTADNAKPAVPPAATSAASASTSAASASTSAASASTSDPLVDARALMSKRQFAEAAAAFQAILAKDPSSPEANAGLVRSLLRGHKLDEAEEAAKKAVAAAPNSAMVHAAAGDVAFRAGKFADTEAEYRAALKLDANSARAQFGMGRMYEMVSMNKRAKETFAKAHQLDPDDGQIFEYWVDTLPYAEQLEAIKKSAGDHPTDAEANRIKYLTALAEKKPWILASELKPTELKIVPYGRELTGVYDINRSGPVNISKGYGLQVKFNDRASAILLLDTGAPGITIGRKLAEKAGAVKIADSRIGGIGDQGSTLSYEAWVDKITIGSVEFHNCVVTVSSKNNIADEAGLIGADVFSKFLVTLDFREQKALLTPLPKNPNAASDDDPAQDRYIAPEMQSFTKFYRFGHDIVVPVVVNDKAVGNFILDTGADLNTMSPKLAAQVTKASADGDYTMKGVSGRVQEVLTGQKAILQFAKMRIESHDLPVFSTDSISASEGTEIAGFIGIRTLVQMKMAIDYRDGLVNLEVYEFRKARE